MNKKYTDLAWIILGILGACITLYGLTQSPSQIYYVIGSSLLLITAIHFRLIYFIALEIILISGHGVILLGIGPAIQIALPTLLCAQLLFFYYFSEQINNIFVIIGIFGIASLSVGFAYANQWVFFIGGAAIAVYAFYYASKDRVALLWAALNTVFATTALVKLTTNYL